MLALIVFAALLLPTAADAQPVGKAYRIGVLSPGSEPLGILEAFRDALHDLGYIEGKTVTIEWRFAEGKTERLRVLADELVRLRVDVILAINTPAAQAAKVATTAIPIVIARVTDPVKTGLVPSFSHPGGNITGMSTIADELAAKRLELLKETLPDVSRVAVIWNAKNPGQRPHVQAMELASPQLALQLQSIPVRGPGDLADAFRTAAKGHANALVVVDDALIATHKGEIFNLAAKRSLPIIAMYPEMAEAGGLLSYGADLVDEYHRAAGYVDRILKGARPGDLPIEQPTRFVLVINLKTAKALGLTIPQSVLLRADRVIK
jgi:putative ABC transport system substrate-binding protein